MIYHLAHYLQPTFSFLNVFHYVSVRAIAALLTSLIFAFLFGDRFITLCSNNFRSKVRDWTPSSHQKKNDTPTMGGLFILFIFMLSCFLWNDLSQIKVWIFFLCMIGFGTIGFFDDWYKINKQKGFSASKKFKLQILISGVIASLWYFFSATQTALCVPFIKSFNPDFGIFLIPWAAYIMIATSNAVNLTDGLDGLATGPLITNFITFSLITYLAGNAIFANYLFIPFTQSAELAVIGASLIGALLGFLWYNTYPAQIFMGDVGSLPLGAGLALMALMARQELLLVISGGIFVLETASVIIQVLSFKFFGKRMFKMAPIHHHFELLGWQESKITIRFWIISLILSLLALLTLKLR